MIVGRNAYGALLVLERANSESDAVYLLDPFQLVYWTDPNLSFSSLTGFWLPKNRLPNFLNTELCDKWLAKRDGYLDEGIILAPME